MLPFALLMALQQGQAAPSGAAPAEPLAHKEVPTRDIVVAPLKDIDAPGSKVTRRTLSSGRTGNNIQSRQTFSFADHFATCAVYRAPDSTEWLRQALDSRTNGSVQAFAIQRLARSHASCTRDTVAAASRGIISLSPSGSGDIYYVRGALFIKALQRYAPDLVLTTRETSDPAVNARFNARETPLTKFRLQQDQRFFEMAICLVRLQPELSSKLVLTDPSPDQVGRIEAAIVNGAPICTGYAKRVYFDASQFRFYIADALYRWAVAVKGTNSLVPEA